MNGLDKVLLAAIDHIGSPYNNLILGLLIAFVAIPALYNGFSVFIERLSGKNAFEVEKIRLEIVKLRYEIEAIKKQNNLPDIDGSLLVLNKDRLNVEMPKEKSAFYRRSAAIGKWLIGFSIISWPLMAIVVIIMFCLFAAIFLISMMMFAMSVLFAASIAEHFTRGIDMSIPKAISYSIGVIVFAAGGKAAFSGMIELWKDVVTNIRGSTSSI